MKAVILAGGFGTRLRPLTHHIPKPLVPLLGRPLVMHIIESLPDRVDTVLLAVNYKKEALEEYFNSVDTGKEIVLVDEEEPLGTGGAIKNLENWLDDTFLVFNGDIVSSVDIEDMVRYHRRSGGVGTIALWRVKDPTAFGVVVLDGGGRILNFQEKPAPGEALSDTINAGIYVLETSILDRIGEGKVSIERHVFPEVLGMGLHGYRFEGYWIDCGTRESLLAAQRQLLALGEHEGRAETIGQSSILPPNRLVGVVCDGCSIGPNVDAENCRLDRGSRVSNSLLMGGCSIGKGSVVSDSILGPGVRVDDGASVIGAILADDG